MTRGFLSDESAQDRAVRQLLMYTALYDIDGVNIDFENVYDDDADRLTGFVARLADKLKEQRVIVSIDTTVPSGVPMWSNCYDRAALAKIVDYYMVMTYDEHWRTSPVAGSVASIGWVDRGIAKTLQYVPKEKLLMGVPFYTREWKESDYGRVRSSTMWMTDVDDRVARYGLTPRWLDEVGQHYIEYNMDGYRNRVWIEDARSLALKVDMVGKYDLAGVAAWRKGFEKPGIWDVILVGLRTKPAAAEKAEPVEADVLNWSLKSVMEKLKAGAGREASQ
jgi:spore germination protein YaaH